MTDIPETFTDENGLTEDIYGNIIHPYHTRRQVEHGNTCIKVPHNSNAFIHPADLDGPYKVGYVSYCGRCHEQLPA